jgi:hypothetical protein
MFKEVIMANLGFNPSIFLEELRKATNNGQDIWSPGRDLNPGTPDYKVGMIFLFFWNSKVSH